MFAFFSKSSENINYDISKENEILKGVNRTIFIDNEEFSKYYIADYKVEKFSTYIKNYKNLHGKDKLLKNCYTALKHSYEKNFENKDVTLIQAIESDFSLHYINFDYKAISKSSTLGILTEKESKLLLHFSNKYCKIKFIKEPKIKFNSVIDEKEVIIEKRKTS